MRGYPKGLKKVQDFVNLLGMKEFKHQALVDLKAIHDFQDSRSSKALTPTDPAAPEKGWDTKSINNSMPIRKQRGFASKQEIANLITQNGGEI